MKRTSSIKSLKKRGQVISRRDGKGKKRLIVLNKKIRKYIVKQ